MWDSIFHHALVGVYVFILAAVAFYGMHRYVLVYLYVKHRHDGYQPRGNFAELPKITVQLPMFNEDVVAERVIRAREELSSLTMRISRSALPPGTSRSISLSITRGKTFFSRSVRMLSTIVVTVTIEQARSGHIKRPPLVKKLTMVWSVSVMGGGQVQSSLISVGGKGEIHRHSAVG